ncbi:MAG: hypothetical protein FWD18_04065 [Micrococcales bacterium]|nr:hypothetical protein [Micrococcales bacterium]
MSLATRSVTTAALAAVVAVVGLFGLLPLAVVSAVLAVAVAVGWPRLVGLPHRPGSSMVIGLTGVGGVVAVATTGTRPDLRSLAVVFAASMLLTFVNELLRRDGRTRLVESVAGTVTGSLLAVTTAGWVACGRSEEGKVLVVAAAVALALAAGLSALRMPVWLTTLVVTAAGAGGGALLGLLLPMITPLMAGLAGLAVGLLVASLHALFHPITALEHRMPAVSAAVLPVAMGGMLVYVASRVLIG